MSISFNNVFNNRLVLLILALSFIACSNSNKSTTAAGDIPSKGSAGDSNLSLASNDSGLATQPSDDMQTIYVTIADTGSNYYKLRQLMFSVSGSVHIPIDTMDRYYNTAKNEIVFSDTDEDEMYHWNTFPRRFLSVSLSLKYVATYT